jgi:hypothetical protein
MVPQLTAKKMTYLSALMRASEPARKRKQKRPTSVNQHPITTKKKCVFSAKKITSTNLQA